MKLLTSPIVYVILAVVLSTVPMVMLLSKATASMVVTKVAEKAAEVEAKRPPKPWDFWTPEVEKLALDLTEVKASFGTREAELATREKRIIDERKELEEVRRQIEILRNEIGSRLIEVQTQELKNLKTLSTTYSKLTPAAAVAILTQMDDVTVTKLLSLMKQDIVTAILQEMSRVPGPDNVNVKRAAELTQRLRLLLPAKNAG